jgi:hypothetical protein
MISAREFSKKIRILPILDKRLQFAQERGKKQAFLKCFLSGLGEKKSVA